MERRKIAMAIAIAGMFGEGNKTIPISIPVMTSIKRD